MAKSVVERLMKEIYEMELVHENVLLRVSVSREKELARSHYIFPPYSAIAEIAPGLDIQGHGHTPEEALEHLKAGIIGQYAPNHVTEKDYLSLPVGFSDFTGDIVSEIGRLDVYVPRSIGRTIACGCSVEVGLRVTSTDGNGALDITPRFNWCTTHIQAYAMRNLLEDEREAAWDQLGALDIPPHTIIETSKRIIEIDKALGKKDA